MRILLSDDWSRLKKKEKKKNQTLLIMNNYFSTWRKKMMTVRLLSCYSAPCWTTVLDSGAIFLLKQIVNKYNKIHCVFSSMTFSCNRVIKKKEINLTWIFTYSQDQLALTEYVEKFIGCCCFSQMLGLIYSTFFEFRVPGTACHKNRTSWAEQHPAFVTYLAWKTFQTHQSTTVIKANSYQTVNSNTNNLPATTAISSTKKKFDRNWVQG